MRLFEGTPWDRTPRCEQCGELEAACKCPPPAPLRLAPERQTARLVVEKRPKGKQATVVRGLAADDNDLAALLARLKNACGAGGALRDESLEIQGSHLPRIRDALTKLGYKVQG